MSIPGAEDSQCQSALISGIESGTGGIRAPSDSLGNEDGRWLQADGLTCSFPISWWCPGQFLKLPKVPIDAKRSPTPGVFSPELNGPILKLCTRLPSKIVSPEVATV